MIEGKLHELGKIDPALLPNSITEDLEQLPVLIWHRFRPVVAVHVFRVRAENIFSDLRLNRQSICAIIS
jgi:hypothetical protein